MAKLNKLHELRRETINLRRMYTGSMKLNDELKITNKDLHRLKTNLYITLGHCKAFVKIDNWFRKLIFWSIRKW